MKKKIVVLMLSAAMTMSMMTGCGNTAKDDSASTTTETTQDAEATEEAEFIVQAARTCHVTAPLVITGGYTVDLAGRAEGVSPEERTTFTKAFCRKVHEDGMMPMIGGEAGWLSSSLDMTALTQEQIWVAQENSSVTWSGTYQIWQYTAQDQSMGFPASQD